MSATVAAVKLHFGCRHYIMDRGKGQSGTAEAVTADGNEGLKPLLPPRAVRKG
jgi:hypothetical protein